MSRRLFSESSLKQLIGEMLRNAGMDKKYLELEVEQAYRELVGPVISRKTREVRLREKTLLLVLDSSVVREELSHQKTALIRAINERFGQVLVEAVEVR